MIYTVNCDNQLLYSPFAEDYVLSEAKLNMIDNGIGSFQFGFYPEHPLYNSITPKHSKIKIYKDGNLFWYGRVSSLADILDDEKQYYVESCLAFLRDSVMRPFEFSGTPQEFFEEVISQHNDQVNEDQRFVLGECTVTDINGYIVRSSIYHLKTYDVIEDKMLGTLGGHLVITYNENEKPVISWLDSIDLYSTQHIRFGENLVDFERNLLYDSFCTAIVPLGHSESGEKRLTIESVNDGKDYLINQQLAEVYGVIYADIDNTVWDDVTVPSILYTKGLNWLNQKGVTYRSRIDLNAEDISFFDSDVGQFLFQTKVIFDLHTQVSLEYLISDFSVDLREPTSVSIVLSDEQVNYASVNLTAINAKLESQNAERIRKIETGAMSSEQVQVITQEEIRNDTTLIQRTESIIATALEEYVRTSDYDEFRSTLATQFSVLAGEVEAGFLSTASDINTLSNFTTQRFDNIYSFIRLLATITDGGQIVQQGGIVIGESTSDIKLKLENDILYFFIGDEKIVANPIAWFSQNQLYVNNSTIQNLTLGTTGAYLDARIVGSGDNICVLWSGRM